MAVKMIKSGVAIVFTLTMVLWFSGAAVAAVVYTDVDPDVVLQSWNGMWAEAVTYNIDFDSDGFDDATLYQFYPYSSSLVCFYRKDASIIPHPEYAFSFDVDDFESDFGKAFETGEEIGPNEDWIGEPEESWSNRVVYLEYTDLYTFEFYGDWVGMEDYTAYAGVHFYSTIDDDWHYGWLNLKIDNENGSELTIYGYAWETDANTAIIAGDTGSPVPIPGAVWLLGSGLLGLAGIRRNRK